MNTREYFFRRDVLRDVGYIYIYNAPGDYQQQARVCLAGAKKHLPSLARRKSGYLVFTAAKAHGQDTFTIRRPRNIHSEVSVVGVAGEYLLAGFQDLLRTNLTAGRKYFHVEYDA